MLRQKQTLKQQTTLNPLQIAQLELFHLDIQNLEQRIELELDENPFLEKADEPVDVDESRSASEPIDEWDSWQEFYDNGLSDPEQHFKSFQASDALYFFPDPAAQTDFREELKQQLKYVVQDPLTYKLTSFIIDSCNDKGYLDMESTAIADEFSFRNSIFVDDKNVIDAISLVKHLEPGGVASTTILEYYKFQLTQKTKQPVPAGTAFMLDNHFADLQKGKWKLIDESMRKQQLCLADILKFLSTLRVSPIDVELPMHQFIIPEFVLTTEGEFLNIELYKSMSPTLRVSRDYPEGIKDERVHKKGEKAYLKQKFQSAHWFVEALRLREKHLLQVMQCIVEQQRQYFWSGSEIDIKPMLLKHVANGTGLSISMVSRLISNKYAVTPFGTVRLKSLFSEGIATKSGTFANSGEVDLAIKEILDHEDKGAPLTDKHITEMLREAGYVIARRTVAKYRERIGYPGCKSRGKTS